MTLFLPSTTRTVPANSEIITTAKGVLLWKRINEDRTAEFVPVTLRDGVYKYTQRGTVWQVKLVDENGRKKTISTGMENRVLAEIFANNLNKKHERIKAGLISPAEAAHADAADKTLASHIADYLESLKSTRCHGRLVSDKHLVTVKHNLEVMAKALKASRLADITKEKFEAHTAKLEREETLAPNSINKRIAVAKAFCEWAVMQGRLQKNPLAKVSKVSGESHARRAFTPDELRRLLEVAATRTLKEAMTIRTGKNAGALTAKLSEEAVTKFKTQGRARALIFKFMAYSGLRCRETKTLTWNDVTLTATSGTLKLRVANTKNAKTTLQPISAELAADLQAYKQELEDAGTVTKQVFPIVPTNRTFDLDLEAADIEKTTEAGVLCLHSLRHTYGTYLAAAGVTPMLIKTLMRHASIATTLKYCHTDTTAENAAVAKLPMMELKKVA